MNNYDEEHFESFKDIMEEFCYNFRDTDDVKDVKEVIGMVDNYFALQE